jgi:virulence-associated protein VapD
VTYTVRIESRMLVRPRAREMTSLTDTEKQLARMTYQLQGGNMRMMRKRKMVNVAQNLNENNKIQSKEFCVRTVVRVGYMLSISTPKQFQRTKEFS